MSHKDKKIITLFVNNVAQLTAHLANAQLFVNTVACFTAYLANAQVILKKSIIIVLDILVSE